MVLPTRALLIAPLEKKIAEKEDGGDGYASAGKKRAEKEDGGDGYAAVQILGRKKLKVKIDACESTAHQN